MQIRTRVGSDVLSERKQLDQVRYFIRKIAENPVRNTQTGAVLEDTLGSSGKMLRTRLLLKCAALGPDYQARQERLCMLAAMVELTHLASLVHDDIVDDAAFRRGRPSVQSRYGKDAAVYAGDFLISRVFSWGVREGFADAVERLARTIEAMCIGEIGQASCRYRETMKPEEYYDHIRCKTASLFQTACVLGAEEAGCAAPVVQRLECLGEYLGLLFQLRDDLLDFTATAEEAGKETHKDFRDGIYTMPVLMALWSPEGKAALLPLMRENRERALTDDEIAWMEREVIRHGGVEKTWAAIHRYLDAGGALLDTFEDCTPIQELRRMWHQLGVR